MTSTNSHLMTLVRKETACSTLLAALIEFDPEPLLSAFRIESQSNVSVVREFPTGNGPIDIAIVNELGPLLWIEVKVGSTQHGDQFDRYASAATNFYKDLSESTDIDTAPALGEPPVLLCVSPELAAPAQIARDDRWKYLSLAALVSLWKSSPSQPARSLVNLLDPLLMSLETLTQQPLSGHMHITDLRVLTNALHESVRARVDSLNDADSASAEGTYYLYSGRSDIGGRPAIYLLRHANQQKDVWALVDARAQTHGTSTSSGANGKWQIRIGVDTSPSEGNKDKPKEEQAADALDAMSVLVDVVTTASVNDHVTAVTGLADRVTSKNNGYRSNAGSLYSEAKGTWVSKMFLLDATGLTVEQFEKILFALLEFAHSALQGES